MILPLEKQVPARETCAALNDAGLKAETHFVWTGVREVPVEYWTAAADKPADANREEWGREHLLPAPTAAELGVLLPRRLDGGARLVLRRQYDEGYAWGYSYEKAPNEETYGAEGYADTEAEARALLWLDLDAKDLLPDASYGSE